MGQPYDNYLCRTDIYNGLYFTRTLILKTMQALGTLLPSGPDTHIPTFFHRFLCFYVVYVFRRSTLNRFLGVSREGNSSAALHAWYCRDWKGSSAYFRKHPTHMEDCAPPCTWYFQIDSFKLVRVRYFNLYILDFLFMM